MGLDCIKLDTLCQVYYDAPLYDNNLTETHRMPKQTPDYTHVPKNLRRIMAEKEIKVRELASKIRIGWVIITKLRNTEGAKFVTPDLLAKLAPALGVDAEKLTAEPEQISVQDLPYRLFDYIKRCYLGNTNFCTESKSNFGNKWELSPDSVAALQCSREETDPTKVQKACQRAQALSQERLDQFAHMLGVNIVKSPATAHPKPHVSDLSSDEESETDDDSAHETTSGRSPKRQCTPSLKSKESTRLDSALEPEETSHVVPAVEPTKSKRQSSQDSSSSSYSSSSDSDRDRVIALLRRKVDQLEQQLQQYSPYNGLGTATSFSHTTFAPPGYYPGFYPYPLMMPFPPSCYSTSPCGFPIPMSAPASSPYGHSPHYPYAPPGYPPYFLGHLGKPALPGFPPAPTQPNVFGTSSNASTLFSPSNQSPVSSSRAKRNRPGSDAAGVTSSSSSDQDVPALGGPPLPQP